MKNNTVSEYHLNQANAEYGISYLNRLVEPSVASITLGAATMNRLQGSFRLEIHVCNITDTVQR